MMMMMMMAMTMMMGFVFDKRFSRDIENVYRDLCHATGGDFLLIHGVGMKDIGSARYDSFIRNRPETKV